MKNYLRYLLPVFTLMLLFSCSSAPVYRGDGIHCAGGAWSEISSAGGGPRTSTDNSMMGEIQSWMGTPYLYGGESRSGVDCSGFTQAVYSSVNIDIPRTASQQAAASQVVAPADLRFGDLIFFNTSGSGISHVGIYLGNGFFAHASSSRGVVRESLSKQYYADRIVSAGRFMQ
jgi:murein DD-endopeptidase / murein LD-carboxypeptidase